MGRGFRLVALLGAGLLAACSSSPHPTRHLEASTLWYQTAGETRALQYQAYQLATRVLARDLRRKSSQPRAVVLDVDETVLNNGPFQGKLVKSGDNYPTHWPEWIDQMKAELIPGSAAFLRYADSKGVKIFYLTNRKQEFEAATIENLKRRKLPQVTPESVVCRTGERSKQKRRQAISKKHRVVLWIGDNLGDFAEAFDQKSISDRNQTVDQLRKKFGTEFIILPNPMYGDWEAAVYDHDFSVPNKQEIRLRAISDF